MVTEIDEDTLEAAFEEFLHYFKNGQYKDPAYFKDGGKGVAMFGIITQKWIWGPKMKGIIIRGTWDGHITTFSYFHIHREV
mmetsp:Transcript_26795/g.33043  ORF Transcript_26795/g.33043 Transcript_26795/m.33043 type:complete len:81 (+) Transcript_26795:374-616(+)